MLDTASYTYDANSNELTASLNGTVYKNSEYNFANLPTKIYYPNSGDDTNRIEYTYRVDGNMHSHRDYLDYTSARIYTYDGAGRLTMDFSALEDENYTDRYTYDARGNISSVERRDRSVSPNVITTTTYTYDRANRLISDTDGTNTTQYTYNGIGNMTAVTKNGEQIKSYTYDNFERLISSTVNGTTTSYAYDGDNLRQTKTTDDITTAHIYDGMNVVADTVGADTTLFIRGNGLVYSKNLTTNERITYNTHSKGDVAQLVKPDGTFTEYTYSAYGRIHYNTTDNANPFTYCGEYTDIETGLVYLRNRYYDPSIGRFITEDPIRDGLNWHIYANNNPINYIDPLGLDAIVITNRNGAQSSSDEKGNGISMGHMAIIVQDENGNWYYFSCGMDYVKFDSVDNKYLNDINSFSEKYYWENQYYTDSTYIKGDFSNSFKYYDNYYKENKTDNNISSYDLVTNNCSTVVLNGLKKGVLKDGTTVRDFIITDLNTDNSLIGSPNSIMKSLQNIFYNSEFTQAASHKVINDMLWQRRNGVWWNRSWYHASRLEKLY